jgi:hypothetical protein
MYYDTVGDPQVRESEFGNFDFGYLAEMFGRSLRGGIDVTS